MDTTFSAVKMRAELLQSQIFGDEYKEMLGTSDSNSFTNLYIADVEDILNSILVQYDNLTEYQEKVLNNIFKEFNNIRTKIDPNRLKTFSHSINDDDELLLYRKTSSGLINIIINPEECTAFSFISNKNDDDDVLQFYYEDKSDYQILCLEFLSRG